MKFCMYVLQQFLKTLHRMVHDVEYMWLVLYWISITSSVTCEFNPYSDNILFHVNWPSPTNSGIDVTPPKLDGVQDENTMIMTTGENEKYKCILPQQIKEKFAKLEEEYYGPSARELIAPLHMVSSCSYRIESYWTYELCHGKYLKQYNERKEANKALIKQEYYLGYLKQDHGIIKDEEHIVGSISDKKVPSLKLEGLDFAYYPVNMTDGTVCDVTNKPRRATLMYICHAEGKGEIFEIKEVSSCEYELIIFTKNLCAHPLYKPKSFHVNKIECHSLEGSPVRPQGLDALEIENSFGRYSHGKSISEKAPGTPKPDPSVNIQDSPVISQTTVSKANKRLLEDFLKGDYCITGGKGYWSQEFCFGKRVSQFHDEKGIRTTIVLGRWNLEKHTEWYGTNKERISKINLSKQTIVNFYSNGDNCAINGTPRHVEVKLRCMDDKNRPNAISISLEEPEICQYILTVESAIICSLLGKADNDGVIKPEV